MLLVTKKRKENIHAVFQTRQTLVHPTQITLTELQETWVASQDVTEFSGEMKPGQLTNQ